MNKILEKKLSNDINEIKEFINAYENKSNGDYTVVLTNLTESIENEEYRNSRAKYISDISREDNEFNNLISHISSLCSSKTCLICPIHKYCNHFINDIRFKNSKENHIKMVDLFCGAGGLSLGFTQEGFSSVLANDIQECCVDTYSHNHPETPMQNIILGDINEVIPKIETISKTKKIDIVVGGPPCQGFSMANRQRLIDDPRNHLYKKYVEIVNIIKPQFFVMENVKRHAFSLQIKLLRISKQ